VPGFGSFAAVIGVGRDENSMLVERDCMVCGIIKSDFELSHQFEGFHIKARRRQLVEPVIGQDFDEVFGESGLFESQDVSDLEQPERRQDDRAFAG